MDPAGFEPASATWTECCVPVTPRALSGVSVLVHVGWVPKLGGNQVPWAALRAGSRLCHSTGAIPTSRKSARCGAPGRCCHNSAHLEVHKGELWPAHCSTPRYALHGPTASRYWWAITLEI